MLAATTATPLVVRGAYGFGRVTQVGIDVDQNPFAAWKDKPLFWVRALDLRVRGAAGAETQPAAGAGSYYREATNDLAGVLFRAMDRPPGVTLVPFGWVAFFIFLYILLIGPGDYFFLKKVVGRMEFTWITFPLMVSIFVQIIGSISALDALDPYMLSTQFNAWQGILREPLDWDPIVRSAWVCALYAVPAAVETLIFPEPVPAGTVVEMDVDVELETAANVRLKLTSFCAGLALKLVPLMRASDTRTMSRTPCASSFFGIGSMPHSGMPGPPSGPAFWSTSTESAVAGRSGSSIRASMSL